MVNICWIIFRAPEQNADFSPVHKDEAFCLVGHVSTESTSHNAVPSRQEHCVEFVFDDLGNIIQNSSLLECKSHAIDCLLLHVLVHVCELHNSILCLLLIDSTVRLDLLMVFITLPFLCFGNSGVCCGSLCLTHSCLFLIKLLKLFCKTSKLH